MTDSPPNDADAASYAASRVTPTEPGFYWRRCLRFLLTEDSPQWGWVPAEVYRSRQGELLCNNHGLDAITWGPRIDPPMTSSDRWSLKGQLEALRKEMRDQELRIRRDADGVAAEISRATGVTRNEGESLGEFVRRSISKRGTVPACQAGDANTVGVRVRVAVTPDGNWQAVGWKGGSFADLDEVVDECLCNAGHWTGEVRRSTVTAHVPRPAVGEVVEGELVEPDPATS